MKLSVLGGTVMGRLWVHSVVMLTWWTPGVVSAWKKPFGTALPTGAPSRLTFGWTAAPTHAGL